MLTMCAPGGMRLPVQGRAGCCLWPASALALLCQGVRRCISGTACAAAQSEAISLGPAQPVHAPWATALTAPPKTPQLAGTHQAASPTQLAKLIGSPHWAQEPLLTHVCHACSDRADDAAQTITTVKLPGYTGASGLPSSQEACPRSACPVHAQGAPARICGKAAEHVISSCSCLALVPVPSSSIHQRTMWWPAGSRQPSSPDPRAHSAQANQILEHRRRDDTAGDEVAGSGHISEGAKKRGGSAAPNGGTHMNNGRVDNMVPPLLSKWRSGLHSTHRVCCVL